MNAYSNDPPVYSHNPYLSTKFPLLVLDVKKEICHPFNEGFRALHWHEELQFVYIREGTVRFRIWEREYDLPAGCGMFINSNVLHHITEKEACAYHSFLIPPRMLGFFEGSVMAEAVEKFSRNPVLAGCAFVPRRKKDKAVLSALEQLDRLYFTEKRPRYWEYRLSVALTELWIKAVDAMETGEEAAADENFSYVSGKLVAASVPGGLFSVCKKDQKRIQKLLDFVHRNYNKKITLEDISHAGCISKAECLRCFKKYTGNSPYQYLQKYRLQVGSSLLETTKDSVTEIAMLVQFSSSSAFVSAFRKHYGVTPVAYRKIKRKDAFN